MYVASGIFANQIGRAELIFTVMLKRIKCYLYPERFGARMKIDFDSSSLKFVDGQGPNALAGRERRVSGGGKEQEVKSGKVNKGPVFESFSSAYEIVRGCLGIKWTERKR